MLTKLTVIILTIYTYIKSFCCKPKVNTALYVSYRASQEALVVKNPPASAGDIRDTDLIPGSGRSPGRGHGNPLKYSCLENPMDRGAWKAAVHGVTKNWTPLKRLSKHASTRDGQIQGNGVDRTSFFFFFLCFVLWSYFSTKYNTMSINSLWLSYTPQERGHCPVYSYTEVIIWLKFQIW